MFYFAFNNYMNLAYPHDELKPISCTPRIRGREESRGFMDDSLGQ